MRQKGTQMRKLNIANFRIGVFRTTVATQNYVIKG